MRQGETGAAEGALAEILDRRLRERATASAEAAEAARNLGAIAYLSDTAKAIEAYRTATELDPDDTWSWIILGRLYQRAGNLAAAEQAFQSARQAAERAGNERDLMVADHGLGDVRVARGDLSGAAAAYEAGLEAAKQRAAQDPSNTDGSATSRSASIRSATCRARGAIWRRRCRPTRTGSPSARSWPRRTRATPRWQRDLSVSFDKIGDVQSARGNLEAALKAYQDGLAIAEKLAAQDPSNTEWQRDLSVSFDQIGDVQSARGNLEAALKAYEDGLAIREKLAAQDPSNTGWQRDLSVSFDKIGDVQSARGNLEAALQAYQDGLAIARSWRAGPEQRRWQRDLSVSFNDRQSSGTGAREADARRAGRAGPDNRVAATIVKHRLGEVRGAADRAQTCGILESWRSDRWQTELQASGRLAASEVVDVGGGWRARAIEAR